MNHTNDQHAEEVQHQDDVITRLDRIEAVLKTLAGQRTGKEWFSPAEAAPLLGKAEFTVREWCRLGRINARKRPTGRGCSKEWMISQDELARTQNEGLLPLAKHSG